MTVESLFKVLANAECGAYAVSIDQTIVFWNEAAERVLGYSSRDVVGRRCHEVPTGIQGTGLTAECLGGCPFIRYLRTGMVPAPVQLCILTATGEEKWLTVTPMVAAGILREGPLLIYLFDDPERAEGGHAEDSVRRALTRSGVGVVGPHPGSTVTHEVDTVLSRREVEVLEHVALGWDTPRIASELGISRHTVRNHIRNLRQRLNASTKLEAVLTAMRMGILKQE